MNYWPGTVSNIVHGSEDVSVRETAQGHQSPLFPSGTPQGAVELGRSVCYVGASDNLPHSAYAGPSRTPVGGGRAS